MTVHTKEDVARLQRRDPLPQGQFEPDRFTIFLPGRLKNFANIGHRSWKPEASYRKRWRKKVKEVLGTWLVQQGWVHQPSRLKRIIMTAHTWNEMDADGLRSSLKPLVDGLKDAGVIDDDRPSLGHRIDEPAQKIDRHLRGVWITVEVR